MDIVDRVQGAIERTPIVKSLFGNQTSGGIGGNVSWPGMLNNEGAVTPDSYQDYIKLYKNVVYIYACVYAIASSGGSVPYWVRRKRDNEWQEVRDHPFQKLIEGPVNEGQSWVDLLEGTLTYLELVGDAYWELVWNDKTGLLDKIYLLRPDRVSIVPTSDGKKVQYYQWEHEDSEIEDKPLKTDDCIHFSYFSPLNDWYGFGSAYAAAETALLEEYALDYSKEYLASSGIGEGFLSSKEPISEVDMKRVGEQWRRRNQGKTPVLPKGLEWNELTSSPKDVDFTKIRELDKQDILAAFKVPPVICGITEGAKYDNFQIQERHFYEKTIGPKLNKIAFKINSFILPNYNTDPIKIGFDIKSALTGNMAQLIDMANKAVLSGLANPNEMREKLDIGGPYEGGNKFYMKSTVNEIGQKDKESNTVVMEEEETDEDETDEADEPENTNNSEDDDE